MNDVKTEGTQKKMKGKYLERGKIKRLRKELYGVQKRKTKIKKRKTKTRNKAEKIQKRINKRELKKKTKRKLD